MSFTTPSVAGFDSVKPMQYVEETIAAYGVMPTASPNFILWDVPVAWRPNLGIEDEEFARLGIEDIYKLLKTGEIYSSVIETGLINSTQLKYGINARGGGAGSIDRSVAMLTSVNINGVENFIKLLGTRIASLTIDFGLGVTRTTYNLTHKSIETPGTAHGLTTPVFAAAPTLDPWTHLDAGANPLSWNATAQHQIRASYTIERNLSPQKTSGNAQISFLPSTNRRMRGDMETLWADTLKEADMKAYTARTLSQVLKSATSTLTLTNAKISSLTRDKDVRSNDVIREVMGIKCESFSIT